MIIGDSISLLNQIGSGSYGSVFFGFDKNTKKTQKAQNAKKPANNGKINRKKKN